MWASVPLCHPAEERRFLGGFRVIKSRFGSSKCSACGGDIKQGIKVRAPGELRRRMPRPPPPTRQSLVALLWSPHPSSARMLVSKGRLYQRPSHNSVLYPAAVSLSQSAALPPNPPPPPPPHRESRFARRRATTARVAGRMPPASLSRNAESPGGRLRRREAAMAGRARPRPANQRRSRGRSGDWGASAGSEHPPAASRAASGSEVGPAERLLPLAAAEGARRDLRAVGAAVVAGSAGMQRQRNRPAFCDCPERQSVHATCYCQWHTNCLLYEPVYRP